MNPEEEYQPSRLRGCAEVALIFILFFVLAGTPPPDVNEAHYIPKAKHYWNPDWCPHDHFLNSADAHTVFYWTFGWLTLFSSLPAVTWIGRILTWGLLAWSWRRLSIALLPVNLYSVLTAALFAALTRWGHMAGEWVIGGLEAKGFAYVLIFLALEALIRDRWRRACIFLGGASAFHVVAGGWAFVAAALTWLFSSRDRRPPLASLLSVLSAAAVLALFGLIPGLALSWAADPETVLEANRIYVFERLSHHLVFHALPHIYMARHALLLAGWLAFVFAWGKFIGQPNPAYQMLNKFVFGAVTIAVAGILLDQSLLYFRPLAASLLRYYWFRLSDVMIPIGATFAAAALLNQLSLQRSAAYVFSLAMTLLVLIANVSYVVYGHFMDPRPGAVSQSLSSTAASSQDLLRQFQDWQRVCSWIRGNTPANAVFLTPRHQQTFQWYAQRSEVVASKNIPQNAAAIVEWRRRLDEIFPWSVQYADLTAHGEKRLTEFAHKYQFQYILVDRAVSPRRLNFPRVYPVDPKQTDSYEVYRTSASQAVE